MLKGEVLKQIQQIEGYFQETVKVLRRSGIEIDFVYSILTQSLFFTKVEARNNKLGLLLSSIQKKANND